MIVTHNIHILTPPALRLNPRQFLWFLRRLWIINGHPKGRPRLIYTMSTRPVVILTQSKLAELNCDDPNHPRIRRHQVACRISDYLLREFVPRPEYNLVVTKVPLQLNVLCKHYNIHFPTLATDLKLSPFQIWFILLCRTWCTGKENEIWTGWVWRW